MSRALVLVVATIVAAACGGPGAGGDVPTLQLVLFGDAEEIAGYRQLVDEFHAANDDLRIALSPVATQDDLMARLTTSFAGGQPPDVFLLNFRRYGQFAAQGAIKPVQPLLDASDVIEESDYAEPAMDAFRFDGDTLTCMPQNLSSLVVYYNTELFADAGLAPPAGGWTWDDFLAAAQAMTDPATGTYGVGTRPTIIRVAPFVWSAGGELVDDEDDPTTLVVDEGPARAALDWFLDLSTVHGVAPPDAEEQSEDAQARFLRGRLGMYLDSRVAVPTLRRIEDFTWDVAPLPVAPGGRPASILHSDAYCISAGGPHIEQAWRFVEFAVGERGQTIMAESGRTVPSLRSVARSPAFLEPKLPPASSQVFLDAEEHMRATPRTATWSRVEKEANSLLAELYYGRIDREEGIRRLVEETRPLFELRVDDP